MNYKICFVCTGNACRSPFAECVTKKLLANAGIAGIDVFSLGTLDWGENPRDAAMVDMAREMGYELTGTTTAMTRERLNEADAITVSDFETDGRNPNEYEQSYRRRCMMAAARIVISRNKTRGFRRYIFQRNFISLNKTESYCCQSYIRIL